MLQHVRGAVSVALKCCVQPTPSTTAPWHQVPLAIVRCSTVVLPDLTLSTYIQPCSMPSATSTACGGDSNNCSRAADAAGVESLAHGCGTELAFTTSDGGGRGAGGDGGLAEHAKVRPSARPCSSKWSASRSKSQLEITPPQKPASRSG